MGYLKKTETDKLPLPSNSEFFVVMKRRGRYGGILEGQSALLNVTQSEDGAPEGAVSKAEAGAFIKTVIRDLIVEWNLTDEQDQPLPITTESIEQLDSADGLFLAQEAEIRQGRRSKEKEGPFEKRSGRGSTATKSSTGKPPA